MLDRPREKLFERHAITTNEQCAMNLVLGGERCGTRMCERSASALNFDGNESPRSLHHEIHLVISLPPIRHPTHARGFGIGEMCANGGLHESPPELTISARFDW